MPEICRFLGIIIAMFYNEHNPAHFHARYNEFKATISIENLTIVDGVLPPRVLGLTIEWATLHKNELLDNWNRAKNMEILRQILPLE